MSPVDIPGLAQLEPTVLDQHIRARGWSVENVEDDAIHYVRELQGESIPLMVVFDTSYADYARRTEELVRTLALVEGRSMVELVDEMSTPPGDILSFRITSDLVVSGTIPLRAAAQIRDAQCNLLLAAAHSVLDPIAHHPRMSRTEAVELVKDCREAQTARGSYVTRVWVPVTPRVAHSEFDAEEPFARQVTRRFYRALLEADAAVSSGRPERLCEGSRQGLSSNFLKALADMRPPGERSALVVDVAWSRARPRPPTRSPRSVRFPVGVFDYFKSASDELRARAPAHGFMLEGHVIGVHRNSTDTEADGEVIVMAAVDDDQRDQRVRVRLPAPAYNDAVEAHREGHPIAVMGQLRRHGRRWHLAHPTGFVVHPVDEDDEGLGP